MLFVEIPLGHAPVIYRAKKCLNLVPEQFIIERYQFSCKPHALQMLKRHDYISGGEIDEVLRKSPCIPRIYPVQRQRNIFREQKEQNDDFTKTLVQPLEIDYER